MYKERTFWAGLWGLSSIWADTLDSELSCGVDGAMFVLSHTLVHARIHQSEAADLQSGAAHFNPVLKRFFRGEKKVTIVFIWYYMFFNYKISLLLERWVWEVQLVVKWADVMKILRIKAKKGKNTKSFLLFFCLILYSNLTNCTSGHINLGKTKLQIWTESRSWRF